LIWFWTKLFTEIFRFYYTHTLSFPFCLLCNKWTVYVMSINSNLFIFVTWLLWITIYLWVSISPISSLTYLYSKNPEIASLFTIKIMILFHYHPVTVLASVTHSLFSNTCMINWYNVYHLNSTRLKCGLKRWLTLKDNRFSINNKNSNLS